MDEGVPEGGIIRGLHTRKPVYEISHHRGEELPLEKSGDPKPTSTPTGAYTQNEGGTGPGTSACTPQVRSNVEQEMRPPAALSLTDVKGESGDGTTEYLLQHCYPPKR